MSSPSDYIRAGVPVSHALVATSKRPEGMDDAQVKRRLQEIMADIYQAKLQFLGTVQDLADEAMGLALVEKSGRFPTDECQLQDAAYRVIRQGIDHANYGLDGVKAGIEIALRAFSLARKSGTRQT